MYQHRRPLTLARVLTRTATTSLILFILSAAITAAGGGATVAAATYRLANSPVLLPLILTVVLVAGRGRRVGRAHR